MKAVIAHEGRLSVGERPDPVPGKGQLLLQVLRCGICGSDLHALRHGEEFADQAAEVGYQAFMRPHEHVVLGHEFCGEVLEQGAGTRTGLKPGTRVVALPFVKHGGEVHLTGLSERASGGYAERTLVEASLAFAVPNGLPTDLAALTEPMAVALHAVRRGEVAQDQVAIVIGCGPVGLAVIAMLKASGVRTVVASDLAAGRRDLARAVGADIVVDPAFESPYGAAYSTRHVNDLPALLDLAVDGMEKLRRLPGEAWYGVWRIAEAAGAVQPKHPVVFECVGVPGVIDAIIASVPLATRVVVVGVCMQPDRIRPSMAINKEVDLRFVLGYTPREFKDALRHLAEGDVKAEPIVTGVVGLAEVEGAFAALGSPHEHAKILVDPRR